MVLNKNRIQICGHTSNTYLVIIISILVRVTITNIEQRSSISIHAYLNYLPILVDLSPNIATYSVWPS